MHQIRLVLRDGGRCHLGFQRTVRRGIGDQGHRTYQRRQVQRQEIQDLLHRVRQGEADQGQARQTRG